MAIDEGGKIRRLSDKRGEQPRPLTNQPALLPQNTGAEASLVGAALIDPEVMETCRDVQPRHLYQEDYRLIWQAACDLSDQGIPADFITVTDLLMQRGQLEDAGGAAGISALAKEVPTSANARYYADIIKRTAKQRTAIQLAGDLAAAGYIGEDGVLATYWQGMRSQMDEEMADIAASRFALLSIGALRMRERPTWLIPGMLQERKQWLVYGDSNVGKSFFTLDLALCLATGEAWLGHRPAKVGPVVYVCAEGVDGIRDRLDAWLLHHGLEDAPNFRIIAESPNLLQAGDVAGIISQVQTLDEPPMVVVFDTLAASMEGGDENSSEDMNVLVGAVRRVQRECGCAVCTVHHSGKDSAKGARGHSSLRAAMDTQIEMLRDEETQIITAKCKKARDAGYFAPMPLKLHPIALDDFADITSCVIVPSDQPAPRPKARNTRPTAIDKAYSVIASFGPTGGTHGELKRAFVKSTDMTESSFNKALDALCELGRIEMREGNWRAILESRN